MCHKIGHGKPLGLGSVKIVVDGCMERSISADGYTVEERKEILKGTLEENGFVTDEDRDLLDSLKKVLNMEEPFKSCQKNAQAQIEYPDVLDAQDRTIDPKIKEKNNNVARHRWYSSNQSGVGGNVQTLPKVSDPNQTLFQYSYTGDITDTSGRGGYRGGTRGNGGAYRGNGRGNGGNDNSRNGREQRNSGSRDSDGGFSNTPFAGLKLDGSGAQDTERKNNGKYPKNGKKRK